MISFPFTHELGLYLTPRFGELSFGFQILFLGICFLVPVLLVVGLYLYELRLISRLSAVGLLLFRLLVITALLFLVLFQPVVGRIFTEELPGRVIVAVDRSDSMDVTDPQRDPQEKLRLAQALRLAEPPEVLKPDLVGPKVDGLTRTDIVRRLLAPDGIRLLDQIRQRHQVELVGFAQDVWDVPADQFDELFRQLRGESRNGHHKSSAFTDLRLPLDLAEKRSRQDRGRILGVVLFTDGRHNWGPSPAAKALELGQSADDRVPVYPVAVGAAKPPPDLAVVGVKAPPVVFKGVEAQVEARLKITGLPAGEVAVEMSSPGQPSAVEKIQHDGQDGYHTVRFSTKFDQTGSQSLTVTARPLPGETRLDNNTRPVVVNVADDKAKALLIDGEARWEFHYLASALLRDRNMDVSSVVMQQPRLGKIPDEELLKVGNPATNLPAGPDALAPYDCIILGDVSPDQLSLEDRNRLERYVSDRGGTLVILAGKRAMPLGYLTGDDPLARLLPIEEPHAVKPAEGFAVSLTDLGKETPFLQLEAVSEQSVARWADLPRHFWGVVGAAKPGAVTLAYVAEPSSPKDKVKPEERERNAGLIVRQNYGFGRVLFVGLDSTWRWRYKTGDTYHHRFWGQAIRWAASDKPLVAGNESLRFGTREPAYQARQDVDVVVRLAEEVALLPPDALVAARVLQPGQGDGGEKAVALVPLKPNASQPRLLEGQVHDLLPGQYEIELVIPSLADKLTAPPGPDGKPGKLRATFAVLAPEGEEMVELGTNYPLLEDLAAKSGGKLLTPETAAEVVDLLAARTLTRTHREEEPLYQSLLALLLIVGMLTVEWVVRKRAGLP